MPILAKSISIYSTAHIAPTPPVTICSPTRFQLVLGGRLYHILNVCVIIALGMLHLDCQLRPEIDCYKPQAPCECRRDDHNITKIFFSLQCRMIGYMFCNNCLHAYFML